jgi:hypothetical protein
MIATMTTKDLLIEGLKAHGFDGLCNSDASCGCGIDDLAPCGGDCNVLDCEPAYKRPCKGAACPHPCDGYDGEEPGDCYTTKKPEGGA